MAYFSGVLVAKARLFLKRLNRLTYCFSRKLELSLW